MRVLNSTFAALLVAGTAVTTSASFIPRQDDAAPSNQSASALVEASIQALGGREALEGLRSVTYESSKDFRVRTLAQNYHLMETDRYVVSSGSQNVTFSYEEEGLSQRIDRTFVPADYWIFVRPQIAPRSFSLVLRDGADGFACMVKSSNVVLVSEDVLMGYLDSAMTEYLVSEATKLSPKLLIEVEGHNPQDVQFVFRDTEYPAVHDGELNVTIAFDPETSLPFLVRKYEDHPIFGSVARDLQLYDYTEVDGIKFPQQYKTLYYEEEILEETIVTAVHVNVDFEPGFFDGLGPDETDTTPSPPETVPGYTHAQLGEWYSNMMWAGLYPGTIGGASASVPAADLPGAHRLEFLDGPPAALAHLVLEFEESVIVFDAPPHQSKLVIQWVKENLDKPISHLWVSHHHHDHCLGVADFVDIGATIIVPEVAASYWEQIPNIKLLTFTEDEPYIHSDNAMQVRFIYQADTPHAIDWTYAVVTSACPDADSTMLTYTADAVSDGTVFDSLVSNAWLLQAMGDGLSKNATIVPAHGQTRPLSEIIELLGSPYPDYDATSFLKGGEICLGSA